MGNSDHDGSDADLPSRSRQLRLLGEADDLLPGVKGDRLRLLLREIFTAAGGHDDWDADDQVMAAERRTAILVTPKRVYGNSR